MSALDEILSHNSKQTGRRGGPPDGLPTRKLCVVTCTDPRLTGLLEKSLGLDRGEAVVVRVPGASGGPDLVRAVATAVLLNGCEEILVLAPTQGPQTRSLDEVLAALGKRGVQRTSIPGDVRAFFGLQPSARHAALESATFIRGQPFLPPDVKVHAATIDAWSGEIEVVERAENIEQRATAAPTLAGLGGLPEGLGVGIGENPLAKASGPVPFELPHLPVTTVAMTPFRLDVTPLQTSDIQLKPTMQFGILETELSGPGNRDAPSLASLPVFTPEPLETAPLIPDSPAGLPRSTAAAERAAVVAKAAADKAEVRAEAKAAAAKHRPPPKKAASAGPAPRPRTVALPAELAEKIEKVRNFYLAEVGGPVRTSVRKSLAESYETGCTNAELVKIAIRPILELGQKRYKIIDELIAVKEAASQLDRASYYSALMQLVQ